MAVLSLGQIGNDITYPLVGAGAGALAGALSSEITNLPPEVGAIAGALVGGAAGYLLAQTGTGKASPKITCSASTITLYDNGSYSPTSISITGSGFSSSSTALISWVAGGQSYAVVSTATGPLGNANQSVDVGSFAPQVGSGYLIAQDAATGTYSNKITLTIVQGGSPGQTGTAKIIASVSSLGSLPASITVGGSGFDAFANDIYLYAYYDGSPSNAVALSYSAPISCGPLGDFNMVSVTIPLVSGASSISIYAQGRATGTTTNAITLSVTGKAPGASISVSPSSVPYSGLGSTAVTVSGGGFPAFANDIYLYSYVNGVDTGSPVGITFTGPISAGILGNFSAQTELSLIVGETEVSIYAYGGQSGIKTPIATVRVTGAPVTFLLLPPSASSVSISSYLPVVFTAQGCTPGATVQFVPLTNYNTRNLAPYKTVADSSGVASISIYGSSLYAEGAQLGSVGMYAYDDTAFRETNIVNFTLTS